MRIFSTRMPPPPPRHSDRALGIRTTRKVRRVELGLRADASDYQPTPWRVLEEILVAVDVDPPQTAFVDRGSGKGRVLCAAATYPFAEVIGVEAARQLHLAAQDNLRGLPEDHRRCGALRSVNADASTYSLPDRALLVYLYNPFGPPTIEQVAERLAQHPHPVTVAYYEPTHAHVFGERFVERTRTDHWIVYERG